MCFSATASFTAAVVLGTIGIINIRKAQTLAWKFFAAGPLLFGIQQACEGVVWLNYFSHGPLFMMSVYAFNFFATAFWPFYIPTAMYMIETKPRRKQWLMYLQALGTLYAIVMVVLLQHFGVETTMNAHHLAYYVPVFDKLGPETSKLLGNTATALYCIITLLPLLISSAPLAWLLFLAIGSGLAVAVVFYWMVFGSVWCFFAAIASLLSYLTIARHNKYPVKV